MGPAPSQGEYLIFCLLLLSCVFVYVLFWCRGAGPNRRGGPAGPRAPFPARRERDGPSLDSGVRPS